MYSGPIEHRRKQIAITGGIAMGKSTVLQIVEACGWRVASADAIARDVFADETIQKRISEAVNLPLPIDRDALRTKMLDSDRDRRALNQVTHPAIVRRLRAADADVVEIPLLIETCLYGAFERVWVVDCPLETQLERLIARLGSSDAAIAAVRQQAPNSVRRAFADAIIRTNQPLTSVRQDIKRLLKAVSAG